MSCFIDLLHGAHIVDERVFNVQGDKEQYFNWKECGFRLYIPAGALLPTETCPVAVKAIIAGRFILPEHTELVSAFYAISASRKFRKKVKTELQHCLLLENEAQTKHLHFIKAHQTNPGTPYHFELQPGGEFMVNTRYAALWQSEFSIEAIVKSQPYPDDESGLYRAHTFYKEVSRHKWIFKFAAIKHLNLHIKVKTETVYYIQYQKHSLSKTCFV